MDFQFCQPKFGALPVLHYYPSNINSHHKPTELLYAVNNLFYCGRHSEGWALPNVVQTLADFSGEATSTTSVSQINFKLEF